MKKPDKSGALKPKTMSSSMLLAMERFSRPNSFQQDDDDDNNALGGNSKFQRCFFSLNASALQFVSSLRVTLEHVLTLESFILCMISSASVLTFSLYEVNGHRLAANVSWAVISFVIIFPLTSSLSEAFKRRERALEHVATFKATLVSYFYGHRDWDWYAPGHLIGSQKSNTTRKERGRMLLPKGHADKVRLIVVDLISNARDVLCMRSAHRLMHLNTVKGREAKKKAMKMHSRLCDDVLSAFNKLSMCTEELKYVGFPGNEAARLRNYLTTCMTAWENLRLIKTYRTPIATRAFARVYIFVHPMFWGPYYANLVTSMLRDEEDGTTNPSESTKIWVLAYACLLSCLSSLAMFGLFNVRYKLEDPFAKRILVKMGNNDVEVGETTVVSTTTDEFTDAKRWEMDSTHFGYSSRDQINVHGEFGEIARAISTDLEHEMPNACGGGPVKEVWVDVEVGDGEGGPPSLSALEQVSVQTFGSHEK